MLTTDVRRHDSALTKSSKKAAQPYHTFLEEVQTGFKPPIIALLTD